jgi:hypothetical protein
MNNLLIIILVIVVIVLVYMLMQSYDSNMNTVPSPNSTVATMATNTTNLDVQPVEYITTVYPKLNDYYMHDHDPYYFYDPLYWWYNRGGSSGWYNRGGRHHPLHHPPHHPRTGSGVHRIINNHH